MGPTKDTVAGSRNCSYFKKPTSASDLGINAGVGIWDNQGVADAKDVGNGKQSGTLSDGRAAAKIPSDGGCVMALAVSPTSRVDVKVVADQAQACDIASKVADIVSARLPKS